MIIESNLFEIDLKIDDFTYYFDVVAGVVENHSVYFTRKNRFHFSESDFLLGVFTFVGGALEEGIFDLIYQSKKAEIESVAGFVQEPYEDRPYEFSASFNSERGLEGHYFIVRDSGYGYAMVISLLAGFADSDIEEVVQLSSQFRFKNLDFIPTYGEILPILISPESNYSKVGNRILITPSDFATS
jgi:hypothetical protein